MTVLRNENRWDRSNVEFSNDLVAVYSKRRVTPAMQYIDYGLNVLSRSCFERFGLTGRFDLADLFEALAERGELAGFEVEQRFYEIGSPAGLAETEEYLRAHR